MKRRNVLKVLASAPVLALPAFRGWAAPPASADIEALRRNWRELLAEGADVELSTEPLRRPNEEWKKILPLAQYRVLREEDTERAYTSPLNEEKRPGVYVCAGCRLPLFTSAMKYDSGTGWPSFFTTIPGAFETKKDYFLIFPRTEYHCVRCGGHHGHVFDDGPPPTGERWCNNGVALKFIPKTATA
ncbi:methionine sulfoxide reductase [Sulfurifustis variabilis]|uniref:peptide-methionine (R)-S-oxide reductase n=1 Tax=Sulfurifustis variabilis TaxID=1675686 RepID=A0A1B4V989_9GAMM|nr:peptide-methionine (R)-S-oxide reductase MsrB [Sulfurifustis variabilis]BAU49212.1 methionine sulfoxide reductase [Sulfurifustis variabilis]